MNLAALAPWEAIQRQFERGGSMWLAALTLIIIVLVLGLLYWFQQVQMKRSGQTSVNDPHKLFKTVMRQIDLTVVQRDRLRSLAGQSALKHPTTLLICPAIFAQHARRAIGQVQRSGKDAEPAVQSLRSLCEKLFDTDLDSIASEIDSQTADTETGDSARPSQAHADT